MASLLFVLFFISGLCGLVYEVLWARQLALVLGRTAAAQALVLCVYMAGLALGNAALGRVADRVRSPLRLYGLLELGVGLLGLLSPALFGGLSGVHLALVQGGLAPAAAWALKAALCVVGLLLPAALMGGTLPALSRHAVRELSRTQAAVASFYSCNSAGAALGALLSGLWLIPAFGLTWPVYWAGAMNLLVGACAWALARGEPPAAAPSSVGEERTDADLSDWQRRLLYGAAFLSGAVALGYEVAWTRLLAMVLGSSAYAFCLMLAAFIAGI
ncbi:MAG: fused MFS/spermidine synthase, partial [Elusimicrobia bacterium]|nr:fused MFS/spermidine synthase [Elusimicrobiota bacterium]